MQNIAIAGLLARCKTRWRCLWQEWLRPLIVGAAIIFPLKSALAEWNYVPSGSMMPTILVGDLVFVNKVAYDLKAPFTTWHLAEWGNPQHGDIVVCFSPRDGVRLVKRVVGVPGDEVELRDDRVFLNGREAPYGPVGPSVVGGLSSVEKSGALFASETLDRRDHAVMVLPRRAALRTFGPLRVPPGSYFVMGDNRDNSNDSRYFGFVPRAQIVGEAELVLASATWTEGVRWGRFFSALN